MPITVQPNRIELSEFFAGFMPDGEEGSLPLTGSPDTLNFMVDKSTGALELRKGYSRLSAGRLDIAGFYIRHVNYYECIDSGTRKRYLICILTNGTDAAANNIRIYAYDLINNTFTRIDTAGRSWAKAKTEHWYAIVENTYYGGTRGEVIYSWHPTDGWNADPTTPSVDTWVTATGNSVAASGEKSKNYAYKKGMKVLYDSKYYSAARDMRFKTWESGEHYRKGERVSRKVDHGTRTYWRSFEAIQAHDSDATNRPGDGSGSPGDYWKNLRLKDIEDEDGDLTDDWLYMPLPGKGVVGTYHGFRLWVQNSDADNRGRVQYSAPAKPERDALIADLDFRPTDWAPVDDNDGDGGGWFTVPFSKGDAVRGLYSYGTYLIIAGRWQTFVLAGTNEQTWTLRELGKIGAIGQAAITEHDGLVYMLSPTGSLYVTDGTSAQEAPGMEKVREWLKDRVDQLMIGEDSYNWHPSIESYGGYLWIALPDNDGSDYTLVYDPSTESFWLTDLPVLSMAVGEKGRAQRAWFSAPITGASGERPVVYQYQDDPGNEVYTDDDPDGSNSSAETNDITFRYRTAWIQFGTTRNERRVRRAWALVTGETGETVTVNTYRNFEDGSARTTVDRTLVGTAQAEFLEAKVGVTDSYAVGLRVNGTANAQLALHGFGADTEPRRVRFHR